MARLFVSSRDVQYINDIAKEFIKDVVGQKIYYYAISTMATKVHRVYGESMGGKVYEKPIALDVLIGQPETSLKNDRFGAEQFTKLEVLVQARDLLDKKISPSEGDYFTYGDTVYEIVSYLQISNIFGQAEYENEYKLIGQQARPGEFDPAVLYGPRVEDGSPYEDTNDVQKVFEQQRGLPETEELGATGDVRQMRERLKDDMPEIALGEGPRRVEPDEKKKSSKFKYE